MRFIVLITFGFGLYLTTFVFVVLLLVQGTGHIVNLWLLISHFHDLRYFFFSLFWFQSIILMKYKEKYV